MSDQTEFNDQQDKIEEQAGATSEEVRRMSEQILANGDSEPELATPGQMGGDPFAISRDEAEQLAEGEPDSSEDQPQQQQQVNLPMLDIPLSGANLTIQKGPNGERIMVAGPIMFRFVLPLPAEAARMVARDLTGGIEVASAIPPMSRRGK